MALKSFSLALIVGWGTLISCAGMTSPSILLAEAHFAEGAEGPFIVKRGDRFFLHYRYGREDFRKIIDFIEA
jgi:hypothetical protein